MEGVKMACRIWCDLETTCLDPAQGHILELALVATDAEAPAYAEVAAQSWVILPEVSRAEWLDTMDPVVRKMHGESGLLAEVCDRGVSLAEVSKGVLDFVRYFGNPAPGREPIAGSSPHFDRRWLEVHLPAVAGYFSHRCFDASTLKRFCLDHGHAWTLDTHEGSGGAVHRALADVRYSISTAREVARLLSTR